MKSYNVKCVGCGNYLSDDVNSLGYVPKFVPNKTKYCQRCFKLKYYSQPIETRISNEQVQEKLNSIDLSNAYVFVVLDVINLENSLVDPGLLNKAERIYFVINKIDCLPRKINSALTDEYINRIIQKHGYKDYDIIYTSVKNNSSIKRLNNEILNLKPNKKIYFIGKTNTGKSSLINKLLALNKLESHLSVSSYMSTTIDFKKINIKRHEIIDTPGFLDDKNILNYVDNRKYSKIIVPQKSSVQRNFQINPNQSLIIEQLFKLDYLEGSKTSFTFYIPKDIQIFRSKLENSEKNLFNNQIDTIQYLNPESVEWVEQEFDLDPNRKYNLTVNGLCLLSIKKGATKIRCKINKNVGLSLNEWAII